ncbi:MAG: hypothetical protein VKQ33_05860 [Candidatus Sericytochromatia bacterium]|nr:hypothetical protein [Candidatus Sericytochromatia bacterium]
MRRSRTAPPSWHVVRPNTPVAGALPPAAPVPLQIVQVPLTPARPDLAPPRTLYQGAGPILVEVPCANEVGGGPALLSFTALGRR